MSELGNLAAALGYEGEAPQWRTTSIPPVEPARFGKDHFSTFAYVETRIVNHRGALDHDHMRCHGGRHPIMLAAKSPRGGGDASRYPTLLAGGEQLPEHDDYDCLDDLIAAGLLEVHMPEPAAGFHVEQYFVDAYDRPVRNVDGELIRPDFVTGLTELRLCVFATFSLTDHGRQVAGDLRAHKAARGSFSAFRIG